MTETLTRPPSETAGNPSTESVENPPIVAGTSVQRAFGLTDVLLITMAMIWGINFVVTKYATRVFSPIAFTGLRVGTAAICLVLFAFLGGRALLERRDRINLLLLGVLGNGLYQLFFIHGVARTRAGNASLIVGAAPAFIALAARARGMERVKARTLLGIGLSVIGVAFVIIGSAKRYSDLCWFSAVFSAGRSIRSSSSLLPSESMSCSCRQPRWSAVQCRYSSLRHQR